MKKLLLATAALLCLTAMTYARPQLRTQSIGWINPSDIKCEATSDHTCVVKQFVCGDCAPFAFTFTDPVSGSKKYQVHGGTELFFWTKEKMISSVTKAKIALKWPSLSQPIGITARDMKVNYVLTSLVT